MRPTRRTGLTTKSDRRTTVAIIGGGASGTILAAQLARHGIRSLLIDGSGLAGKGLAYSTTDPAHLLNVRAERMSALPGDPGHFARQVEAEGGSARGFAQRRLFASYLGEILNNALGGAYAELAEAMAVDAVTEGGGWRITLADGSSVEAKALVLATGNQPPERLPAFEAIGRRFIAQPWGQDATAAVADLAAEGSGDVMLIGTGLTAIDTALSLDASGYSGRIVAISRRGLLPRVHSDAEPARVDAATLPRGLRAMTRWLRRRSAEVGWRSAVDGLRPLSHGIWQGFTVDEQRRFLRHARAWWDVHRHRIAPEVGAIITRMIADGRLEVVSGRIGSAREKPQGVEVEYRRRGTRQSHVERFDYVFNCTGPLHGIERSTNSLLRALLAAGTVKPDQLGIGLAVDELCRAGPRLWAMGPLTKGRYWEIIAVPDIREQAAAVADDIQRELAG